MTLLEELAQLLADLGLGTYNADGTPGGTIYHPLLPASPDRCLAIARYGSSESDSVHPWDSLNVQIRVRGPRADARIAEADAQAVYDALHGLGDRELAGGTWLELAVCTQGGPVYIGPDANGRHEWTVNFRIDIQRPTLNRPEPSPDVEE